MTSVIPAFPLTATDLLVTFISSMWLVITLIVFILLWIGAERTVDQPSEPDRGPDGEQDNPTNVTPEPAAERCRGSPDVALPLVDQRTQACGACKFANH